MATYKNTITVPTGTDFTNGNITLLDSLTESTGTPSYPSIAENVDFVVAYYQALLSKTITYTNSTSGGNDIYVLTFVDPDTSAATGVPLAITLQTADDSIVRSSAWYPETSEPNDIITCPTCQEITRTACESSYSFVAGLTPSTVYYVVIENNRNKRYVQVVTTDGSGDFAIDADAPEFPIGFFIPEQYKYTIKVYSDSTLINQQDLTVGSTIYQCITLGFVNTVTTTASADFGVDFLIDDELNYIVDDLGNTFSV